MLKTDHAQSYNFPVNLTDSGSVYGLAAHYISTQARVLELGCFNGNFLQALKVEKHCQVTGYELDPTAVAQAKKRHLLVSQLDLNCDLIPEKKQFDVIVMLDVIEHLQFPPQKLLAQLATLLAKNGRLIISIPNLNHIDVLALMLSEGFSYKKTGLLDETHCHFYSVAELKALFQPHGLNCVAEEKIIVPPGYTNLASIKPRYRFCLNQLIPLVNDNLALTYQYLLVFSHSSSQQVITSVNKKKQKIPQLFLLSYPWQRLLTLTLWIIYRYWQQIKNYLLKKIKL